MNDPTKPLSLSHSGAGCLTDCETRFVHKYIAKTERDPDYRAPTYFKFGSCAHAIVERCNYDSKNCSENLVRNLVFEHGLDWNADAPKIQITLPHYWRMAYESKTVPLAHEIWFENDLVKGKVDAVAKEIDSPAWWIIENKWIGTALDPAKPTLLRTDPQTCLYVAFGDLIAEKLGLNPDDFAGVRFREIEKPRNKYRQAQQKPGKPPVEAETHDEFLARLLRDSEIKSRETVIPANEIKWEQEYNNFLGKLKRARELQTDYLQGSENFGLSNKANCVKWGNPCEFWSKCYGETYTTSKGKPAPEPAPEPIPDLSFL